MFRHVEIENTLQLERLLLLPEFALDYQQCSFFCCLSSCCIQCERKEGRQEAGRKEGKSKRCVSKGG